MELPSIVALNSRVDSSTSQSFVHVEINFSEGRGGPWKPVEARGSPWRPVEVRGGPWKLVAPALPCPCPCPCLAPGPALPLPLPCPCPCLGHMGFLGPADRDPAELAVEPTGREGMVVSQDLPFPRAL